MPKNRILYSKAFDEAYKYEGTDLGAWCKESGTVFKVWAPIAERVEVCFREGSPKEGCYDLKKEEKGIWSVKFPENLKGIYYLYRIWHDGQAALTPDPYAIGCSANGEYSMVVDLRETDPEGFGYDQAPEKQAETIIYELHIRDFSMDPESGIPENFRGKYKAFTVMSEKKADISNAENNPKKNSTTGISYLKELGITHVHLLPFYDYGWLDENGDGTQYNWGYDPMNYNVPEGSYATDVKDGRVRIRECKEMIQALHKAGLRVIMDVVYNHTYEENVCFERTAPGYYYRTWKDGSFSNGSACGNDMAAGRAMVDNYIVNSVLYWAREYHVDGFRFDLMGLLTTDLMNRIRQELDREFGEGEKLLYGEPWRASDSPMEEGTYGALKENIQKLSDGIAVFSDDTRDTLKGSAFHVLEPGFVNGGDNLEKKVLHAVKGWVKGSTGIVPRGCSQMIQYTSAHDNYTLWDKLLISMRKGNMHKADTYYLEPHEDVLAANKLAALICFCCQGTLFLHAGEEFGRTKFGDENSFRSSNRVNMLRWSQREVFEGLVSYYKGLISLRKKLPGLCDKSPTAFTRIYDTIVLKEKVVSFKVKNCLDGDISPWKKLVILFNASDEAYRMALPDGMWELLANGDAADIRMNVQKEVCVPAHTGAILGQ